MKCAALTFRCFCLGSEATSLFFRCTPSRPSAQVARDVFRFVQPLAFPDATLRDHDHDDNSNNNVGRNASVFCFAGHNVRKHLLFPFALLLALNNREKEVFKKCYFCFAKGNDHQCFLLLHTHSFRA